jgi:menaquinone-dependent protoporphyrinogen oxidase
MARILIAYGTREGQTARIVDEITLALEAGGHDVDVRNLKQSRPETLGAYDGAIVAASVHIGAYENEVRHWVRDHVSELDARPNAFVSVSLSAANHDAESIAGMDAVIQKFRDNTGWEPGRVVRFAGALLYSKYNWLVKRILRRIVRGQENGRYTDMTRDYVLTDFGEVRDFSREFGEAVRMVSPRSNA